jgi:ankyrin repeat protein
MFGASPLHRAAAQGNQVLAALLLTYGADPWALDDGARTPPQLAARSGNQALAKLLSFYAANPRTVHATGPLLDHQARAPEPAGILRVSTDAGTRRPGDPVTRTDAAAQPTGQ